ncbi:Rv3654c family TadE-like protein [Actinomadura parmotrematis]|uniref:Flp pilus-assembly TadE/G-like family protein n=1 Tax=Actinomadura parmotrematis TaxID=2864039 RepID=A0ABS7FRB0_9ACTN|nr:Rv3654c family TadE-like protein [Actinomadura parmotrematis]MBW8482917.1 flp pilus-assembly TadE/G-like family protein [Actinomadura parmotrematis]
MGTVLAVAFMGVVWSAGMAVVMVGGVRAARQQADIAADLGALAGARHVAEGAGAACRKAGEIVAESRGRLSRCAVHGRIVEVSVVAVVRVPVVAGGLRVVARSRAGPVVPEGVG